MSYLTSLSNDIVRSLSSVMVSGTILNQVYAYFPFYKFVYQNAAYKEIVVIVSYDILFKKLTIISNRSIAVEAPKPQRPNPEVTKPKLSGNLQSQKPDL
jgi:hypothetical protein